MPAIDHEKLGQCGIGFVRGNCNTSSVEIDLQMRCRADAVRHLVYDIYVLDRTARRSGPVIRSHLTPAPVVIHLCGTYLSSLTGKLTMNTLTLASIATITLLAGTAAKADCPYPEAPSTMPDGATATTEQMIDARNVVLAFDADVRAFTVCLELEARVRLEDPALSESARRNVAEQLVMRNDAAIDHAESVVARFNEQLRIYRERMAQE
jgi:hypothetical protein